MIGWARAVMVAGLMSGAMALAQGSAVPVKIVLVGDSTVALEGGWGPGFCAVMKPNVTCVDLALNGRSTKSFIDQGAWKKALEEKGNYYLIQFGHNDQKPDVARHTDADGSFQDYLKRYIREVREIGGVPVLVTSLSRRTFKDGKVIEDLKEYAAATKTVGAAEHVTVIDLNAISTAMLNKGTQEDADKFDAVLHPDAKADGSAPASTLDRTHLNAYGQKVFGRVVADELARTVAKLRPDVVREVADAAMTTVWRFDQTAAVGGHPTEILGHPTMVNTPAGKAVYFNGVEDALFVKVHPLAGATTWTWEMIFKPDADGNAEQRVFHLQSVDAATGQDYADERMLFEIRIRNGSWCLDSFATAGGQSRALLNCDKVYPFGKWYRVTTVYDGKTLKNYVGDELQGEGPLVIPAERPGRSSMGVRINLKDYYKGSMYSTRFTRAALKVAEFMKVPTGLR